MKNSMNKNVWEIIWDYDPNGLIVIDEKYEIQLINPAFVRYFHLEGTDIIGRNITEFFSDIEDFVKITEKKQTTLYLLQKVEQNIILRWNVVV